MGWRRPKKGNIPEIFNNYPQESTRLKKAGYNGR